MAVAEEAAASDLVALIHDVALQVVGRQKRGWPCEVVEGSWRPEEGTVEVRFPHTNAIPPTDTVRPLTRPRYPVGTFSYGRQSGPRGGERGTIIPRGGKYLVMLHHDADDSWGAGAGEDVYYHLNAQGVKDSWVIHKNDGANAGDGLGGLRMNGGGFARLRTNNAGAGAFHTIDLDDTAQSLKIKSTSGHTTLYDDANRIFSTVTSGGLIHRMNDATQQITHVAANAQSVIDGLANLVKHSAGGAGGVVTTLLDGAGRTISHAVPAGGLVALGGLASALAADPTRAIISQSHLALFETALALQRKLDMVTLTTALMPFLNNGAGALAAVQALAALAHIGVPGGSSKAYADS